MAAFDPLDSSPELYRCFLWRLIIAAEHQGNGYGRFAVEALCDEALRRGHRRLRVSWTQHERGPEGFYLRSGFRPTGERNNGEVVAERILAAVYDSSRTPEAISLEPPAGYSLAESGAVPVIWSGLVKYRTPDGWSVEVIDLACTGRTEAVTDPRGDGEQLLIRRHGRLVAYVRTPAELAEYLDLADLHQAQELMRSSTGKSASFYAQLTSAPARAVPARPDMATLTCRPPGTDVCAASVRTGRRQT